MKYLLDTNICIYCIRKTPQKVFRRIHEQVVGDIGISAITFSELEFGVANSSNPDQNQTALSELVSVLEIADYTSEVAPIYGAIRAALHKKGQLIGPLDLLIAAHSLYLGTVLVTNNVREFNRVPGLHVENWTN